MWVSEGVLTYAYIKVKALVIIMQKLKDIRLFQDVPASIPKLCKVSTIGFYNTSTIRFNSFSTQWQRINAAMPLSSSSSSSSFPSSSFSGQAVIQPKHKHYIKHRNTVRLGAIIRHLEESKSTCSVGPVLFPKTNMF